MNKWYIPEHIKTFEKNNFICLFNSITMEKLYGGKILYDIHEFLKEPIEYDFLTKKLPSKIVSQLSESNFIINGDADINKDFNNIKLKRMWSVEEVFRNVRSIY